MARRDEVSSTSDILLYFVALVLPPVPVGIKRGCGADLAINICLTILGWLPGLLHAWYIVSKYSDYEVRRAPVGGPAPTPYHHHHQQAPLPGQSVPPQPPQPQQPYYPSEPAPPLYPGQPATKKI